MEQTQQPDGGRVATSLCPQDCPMKGLSTQPPQEHIHTHTRCTCTHCWQKYTYMGGSNRLILSCSLAALGSSRSGKCTHTHNVGASIHGVGLLACLAAAPGPQSLQALAPLASCGCGPTPGPFGTTPSSAWRREDPREALLQPFST